jgi:hypothetical protein
MEKTFQLDQKESQILQQLDQERTQFLAAIGALSLDMETARRNLEGSAERQRAFIRQALLNRNVDRFDGARAQNGTLFVTLPDQPAAQDGPGPIPAQQHLNGPVIDTK